MDMTDKKKFIVRDCTLTQPMNELFAILALDDEGNEGIVSKDGWPLVFGTMENLKLALENFSFLAKQFNKKLRLCRFMRTEVIRETE